MLKYYLDLMFHLSDSYNINPYLLVTDYTTNTEKTHVMTFMLAEKICNNIENLKTWESIDNEQHLSQNIDLKMEDQVDIQLPENQG